MGDSIASVVSERKDLRTTEPKKRDKNDIFVLFPFFPGTTTRNLTLVGDTPPFVFEATRHSRERTQAAARISRLKPVFGFYRKEACTA